MAGTRPGLGEARTVHAGELALAETIASLGGPVADASTPPAVPTGGGRFEVESLLGEGGMGRVHVARDRQFGRVIALKELAELAASEEGARRFVVESLVTGNLEHPGIPAVYERGVREGRPFYAMRRVEGRPLSQLIAEATSLEARLSLLPVVVQVANTLGFAHARGVVHRDIKPDNVVVGAHGEVAVLDWGIAKVRGATITDAVTRGAPSAVESDDAVSRTLHGSVLGTPAYMAPEQARGDVDAIDARTDVFAVGAMLYHVLTGRAPYGGPTSMAILAAALEARPAPIHELAPEIPAPLRAVVERAMATDPRERFPDADGIARTIGSFMTEAVTQKPSLVARVVVGVASFVALVSASLGTLFVLSTMPGLEQQGGAGLVYALLAAAAFALVATEWLTRGKHALLPLVHALTIATVLTGVSGTFAGIAASAHGTSELIAHPPEGGAVPAPGGLFLEGLWESSGSAAAGCQLGVLLVVLAAITARRNGALVAPTTPAGARRSVGASAR